MSTKSILQKILKRILNWEEDERQSQTLEPGKEKKILKEYMYTWELGKYQTCLLRKPAKPEKE
jgi:RAB protein geranylgeranyltransferase component A